MIYIYISYGIRWDLGFDGMCWDGSLASAVLNQGVVQGVTWDATARNATGVCTDTAWVAVMVGRARA